MRKSTSSAPYHLQESVHSHEHHRPLQKTNYSLVQHYETEARRASRRKATRSCLSTLLLDGRVVEFAWAYQRKRSDGLVNTHNERVQATKVVFSEKELDPLSARQSKL